MQAADEIHMARAVELARRAAYTAPNPRVGAVVVKDGVILGHGWHEGAGAPHAEAVALDGIDARGATLYVTLEPCHHQGRTPPCDRMVVEARVERVVVAMEDPDERVRGRGFGHLRDHGIEVTTGTGSEGARRLNLGYVHQRATGRPLVTMKLAFSLDGRLSAPDGSARWITGESTRRLVHRRRLEVDAVMVGAGTVGIDHPLLSVRAVPAPRQPARILVDSHGRISPDEPVLRAEGETIIATTSAAPHERQVAWKEAGAEVIVLPDDDGRVALDALIAHVARRGWLEILCEGGGRLATSLLAEDLVDVLEIHTGAVVVGRGGAEIGELGVTTMGSAPRWGLLDSTALGDDVVTTYERRRA